MTFNDYVQQGIKFFQEENFSKALENLEAALKLQPDNEDIRQMVEMLKMQTKMASNANQALEDEIKHRLALLEKTDVEQAIAEFTKALKDNSNDASAKGNLACAYYIRGLIFMSKKENTRAIQDYSEAIKLEPNYPLALNKRGWLNLEIGNYDPAIKDFEKLIQINSNDDKAKQKLAGAYLQRGISFDKKSDYANAIPNFEMCLKYAPDNNTARELLAMAKAEMAKK